MVTIRDAFPGFSVDDIDAAREFYGTKLGSPVGDDPADGRAADHTAVEPGRVHLPEAEPRAGDASRS